MRLLLEQSTLAFQKLQTQSFREILPTGVTKYEHVVSLPFNEIPGADDLEKAERLVQKCIEVRGVKVKVSEVPVPIPYGSAFEGEVVARRICG